MTIASKKVYIAASWSRRNEMREWRDMLVADGHKVTSGWLDDTNIAWEPKTDARNDIDDICRSNVFVAVQENAEAGYMTGGRHVEFGYALAKGIDIIVVGKPENIFGHLNTWRAANLSEVRELLRGDNPR